MPGSTAVVTAISSTENHLGVARKLGESLPRFDPRQRLIDAIEAEAWTDRFLVTTSRFDPNWTNRNAFSQALLNIFVRPFARICAAERAEDELRNAKIVRDLDRCVFEPPKL